MCRFRWSKLFTDLTTSCNISLNNCGVWRNVFAEVITHTAKREFVVSSTYFNLINCTLGPQVTQYLSELSGGVDNVFSKYTVRGTFRSALDSQWLDREAHHGALHLLDMLWRAYFPLQWVDLRSTVWISSLDTCQPPVVGTQASKDLMQPIISRSTRFHISRVNFSNQ